MNNFDITVICTFHDEDYLVGATLGSLVDAVDKAKAHGRSVEIIFSMDRPSKVTKRLVEHHAQALDCSVCEFDLGDQGIVRNSCVEKSSGKYIAFLDGDDLFGHDWLWRGYQLLESDGGVVHPEINMFFEGRGSIFVHKSSTDSYFDVDYFRAGNYWDAMCMSSKDILESFPYRKRDMDLGFAYEDWDWNMRTLANGIEHHVAKDTVHFKRARKTSQSKRSRDRGVVHHTNELSFYDCHLYREDSQSTQTQESLTPD